MSETKPVQGAATGGTVYELTLDGLEVRRWNVGAQPTEIAATTNATTTKRRSWPMR